MKTNTTIWTIMNKNGKTLKYKNDVHRRIIFNGDSARESTQSTWTFASYNTAIKALRLIRKTGRKGCLVIPVIPFN